MKRGLSAVVATVLLISIVIVIGAVVFVVVRNVALSGTSGTGSSRDCYSLILKPEHCSYSQGLTLVKIVPEPGKGKGNLTGVSFSFLHGDREQALSNESSLQPYKTYDFFFSLDYVPDSVTLAGLLGDKVCPSLASDVPCVPSVCGNGVVEAGEACDILTRGAAPSCVDADGRVGTSSCFQCRLLTCNRNT